MTSPRLFIELYLDEDVDVLVAELLRARGYVARTTREEGMLGSTDEQQLAHAIAHGLTVLTHNRADFEALAQRFFERGDHHAGIIVAVRHPAHEIVRRLLVILNAVTADEMRDTVRYI